MEDALTSSLGGSVSSSSVHFKILNTKSPAGPAHAVGSVRGTQGSSSPLCWDELPSECHFQQPGLLEKGRREEEMQCQSCVPSGCVSL